MIRATWIEIPVKDINRAARFYQAVFELPPEQPNDWGVRRTLTLYFDPDSNQPGISLNQTANFEPSDKGVFMYFDCGEDLTPFLNRVEPAGGKITTGRTQMEPGFYASFLDTEGNLLGLWSSK
jgi:predicted enzyme related to lactoylglutathione lyase